MNDCIYFSDMLYKATSLHITSAFLLRNNINAVLQYFNDLHYATILHDRFWLYTFISLQVYLK